MKHTPGPWQFVGKPNLYTHLENTKGELVIDLTDDYHGYPECGQDLRMDIEDADANLIVAAPDMYEALERIIKSYDHEGVILRRDIIAARKALSKADGQE